MRDRFGLDTFADVLRRRAAEQPHKVAFTWLETRADDEILELTYAELDRRARAAAALLQQEGPAGERALLVYPPGLDFVAALFGCFYAGWIAVPSHPPLLQQRAHRLRSIVRDAQPLVALTSAPLLGQLQARAAEEPEFARLRWRAVVPGASADTRSHLERDALAVLQYTSGSTAAPRGVMLTHANLLHNVAQIERRFGIADPSKERGVIWLPPYHDMGLVGGILEGVYADFPIDLMPPVAFLQRPRRWLEAITRTRATISGGPNFAYDLCVDRIPPSERIDLDLSSWRVAFNGAEPVRETTLRRFAEAFGPAGFRRSAFYPCYGLAEATLMVTGGCASREPTVVNGRVGSGHSIHGQQVLIVHPSTCEPCADGTVGEVLVSGPSVATGYWANPALTAEVFQVEVGNRLYLRTGDLGFVRDAELFVTGRLKAVLILGGRKVQAEDIEATLTDTESGLRPAGSVALSVDVCGDERLVIIKEVWARRSSVEQLEGMAKWIRMHIAKTHQLPVWAVVLTRPGGVPRTSSGKVRRGACREAFVNHQLEAVYEWQASASNRGIHHP